MSSIKQVIDIDLAIDVKDLIKLNEDVKIDDSLKNKIKAFDDDALLKVTKSLGSLEILDAVVVDDALLEKEL